jgi:two-component system, LuxR family, sensor kinase FixL
MLSFFLRGDRKAVLFKAALMIGLIAFADWRVEKDLPLGFLYLFPMLLVGSVLSRWQIVAVAACCTLLTEVFDSFQWRAEAGLPRDILIFAAFAGMGLFVYEIVRSRQVTLQHLTQIQNESEARRAAEEQLQVLVETSPAAIFTVDSEGRVLLANDAAHRLLALAPGTLPGKSIRDYLPSLVNVPAPDDSHPSFRTVMQCRGQRQDGEAFLADIWFSTYKTSVGSRLAAMVVDTSEDLRTREEFSLHQLLAASRILVGAVSHEVRNVCGAIAVVHENLSRSGALAQNKDFEALGTLILALEKIAAMDLRQTANQAASVDIQALLEELRIVVEPSFREKDIELQWTVEKGLPVVWADRQSLMQVFLNLTKNSERALLNQPRREVAVSARFEQQRVIIRFRDTGCGVADPERLFRPFQHGAQATGLGLFLSRALMRSFRGDLRYEPEPQGSSFIVDLSPVLSESMKETYGTADPDFAGGRSQPVPGQPQPVASSRA